MGVRVKVPPEMLQISMCNGCVAIQFPSPLYVELASGLQANALHFIMVELCESPNLIGVESCKRKTGKPVG